MVNDHLPCLIFSSDGKLCDEKGVLSSDDGIASLAELEKRFIYSLRDDVDGFVSFCSSNTADYRIYRMRSFTKNSFYRFAFCEKDSLLGDTVTAVYLAHDVASFHALMSPSSAILRTNTDVLTSELLQIKSSALSGAPGISAEAFSVASRIPNLCEAIFDRRSRARYCDLFEAVKAASERIASSAAFSSSVSVGIKPNAFTRSDECGDNLSPNIIEFPVEAFVAVLTILCSAAAALSSSHTVDVTVSYYAYAADVVISTVTDRLSGDIRLAGPRSLADAGAREDLIRIAETIAYISGIDLSVSFDGSVGVLSVVIGLGYEMQSPPDFKYSDPLEALSSVADEIEALIGSI